MGSLEQAVRRSLTAAAQHVPAYPPDPAAVAIRRGRRAGRVSGSGRALAVMLATVLAASGAIVGYAYRPGQGAALPVDVVVGQLLLSRTGSRVELDAAGTPSAVYATAYGWLVVGEGGVWSTDRSGELVPVLGEPADAVVVEPGGHRVAWRTGTQLSTATITDGRAGEPVRTQIPPGVQPVGFAGDAVRLADATGGQGVWGTDAPTPTWAGDVLGVYGSLPDGELVGQVRVASRTGERCLARIRAADLVVTASVCGLDLAAGAAGWVSPNGRWLVAAVGSRGALVDLSTVFDGDPRTVDVGAAPVGAAAWEGRDTLVRVASGRLERLRLDQLWTGRSGGRERIDVAGVGADTHLLVVASGQP